MQPTLAAGTPPATPEVAGPEVTASAYGTLRSVALGLGLLYLGYAAAQAALLDSAARVPLVALALGGSLACMLLYIVLRRLERLRRQDGIRQREIANAQEVLQVAHASLEARVAQRTRELESANAALEQQVAERERAQESLRRSEEHFRALTEDASESFFIMSAGGTIRYAAPASDSVSGHSREERVGRSAFELVHPDDVARVMNSFRRVAETPGATTSYEFRLRHRDGGWRLVEASVKNLLEHPAVEGIVVTLRDVEDRRRAADASLRLEAILETTPDFVKIADLHGRVLYINAAGRRMVGLEADEPATDYHISDLHPQSAADLLITEGIPAAVREGSWTGETELLARDGRSVPVSQVIVAQRDRSGVVTQLATVSRDLTERIVMEEALKQSERDYRGLFEGAHDAILVIDAEKECVLDVNQRGCDLYGYTREELVGLPLRRLSMDIDRLRGHLSATRRDGLYKDFEAVHRHCDGSELPLEINAAPIEYRGRDAILSISRDIRPRRQLEEQLRQAQKMEAVGRLAGGVSHDFNNLLTSIKGYAQLALAELDHDSVVRADIEEVDRVADRAAALTRQLLAFSRKQVLQPRVLNVSEVVADMRNMIGRLLGDDVAVTTELADPLDTVEVDRSQLEQVILNLAINARDAMPNGGRLWIRTANHVGPAGRGIELTVRDDGAGMGREVLERIFEPFFTTKEQGKGTGLGLSTVYGIVKQSGGEVTVESEPGTGTTFRVWLPRVDDARREPGPRKSRTHAAGGSETILLVEDDPALRRLTHRILERSGYAVLEATNGAAALELAAAHPGNIDLLLTDVVMPEVGGRALAEQLLLSRPELTVIFMSGYDEEAARGGRRDAGGFFLQKPFDPELLTSTVRQALDRPVVA